MRLALPFRYRKTRWALTPPFHPYRFTGGIFSVALSVSGVLQHQPPGR